MLTRGFAIHATITKRSEEFLIEDYRTARILRDGTRLFPGRFQAEAGDGIDPDPADRSSVTGNQLVGNAVDVVTGVIVQYDDEGSVDDAVAATNFAGINRRDGEDKTEKQQQMMSSRDLH